MNRLLLLAAAFLSITASAVAQSPIQWSGNTQVSIERAKEQQLPLMFWVTQRSDLLDDDDLRDAQEQAFRDPAVVAIAQQRFVPVRVARNSNVLKEAEAFGLPTEFGLYIALITPDGKLLEQIDPLQVASPEALAQRLAAAFRTYRDNFYTEKLKGVITDPAGAKPEVRAAVQTVWRLTILSADADVAALLKRPDINTREKSRLYTLLASFATQPCIDALLSAAAAGDRDAAQALTRAEAGALQWLLTELPGDGEPTERQLAAYTAATRITRATVPRPAAFWKSAGADERTKELDMLRRRAEPVLSFWTETTGSYR